MRTLWTQVYAVKTMLDNLWSEWKSLELQNNPYPLPQLKIDWRQKLDNAMEIIATGSLEDAPMQEMTTSYHTVLAERIRANIDADKINGPYEAMMHEIGDAALLSTVADRVLQFEVQMRDFLYTGQYMYIVQCLCNIKHSFCIDFDFILIGD